MNYRNPKYNKNGTIDVEIEHPFYGWIPFTASPEDCEEKGRKIFEEIVINGNITPYSEE